MSDDLQKLRRLEAETDKVLKRIRAAIDQQEAADAEEEARKRRHRFRVIGVLVPAISGAAALIRRAPRTSAALGSGALATTAVAAVIVTPHLDGGNGHPGNGPRVVAPRPPHPSPTPRRTKKTSVPTREPGVPSSSSTSPGRSSPGTVVTSPADEPATVLPLSQPIPRPTVAVTHAPPRLGPSLEPSCVIDVRQPVSLRVCLRS